MSDKHEISRTTAVSLIKFLNKKFDDIDDCDGVYFLAGIFLGLNRYVKQFAVWPDHTKETIRIGIKQLNKTFKENLSDCQCAKMLKKACRENGNGRGRYYFELDCDNALRLTMEFDSYGNAYLNVEGEVVGEIDFQIFFCPLCGKKLENTQ